MAHDDDFGFVVFFHRFGHFVKISFCRSLERIRVYIEHDARVKSNQDRFSNPLYLRAFPKVLLQFFSVFVHVAADNGSGDPTHSSPNEDTFGIVVTVGNQYANEGACGCANGRALSGTVAGKRMEED